MKEKTRSLLYKILPYVLILVGFIVIAYAFTPYVLQGKIINQSDINSWRGMANEIITYNEEHPDEQQALWTNSMFGGMPATQISVQYKGDCISPIYDCLFLGKRPSSYFLISMIGGFLLFLAFGVNPWLSALGAFAITFCSYNMQIMQVGHNSKMVAIAFMPWVLAAAVYAYRKRPLGGALLFALAMSFQIKANHPQITYYLAILVLGYAIAEMCGAIKNKKFVKWLKTSAFLLVFGIIGIATNSNKLLPTIEFSDYTMRGGSELVEDSDGKPSGLDMEYATAWSYGIDETFNLLIPDFKGGASTGELSEKSETYQFLRKNFQNPRSLLQGMPLYWGPQPFTAGPMYMGAISIFLFVLGLFVIKGRYKWWIVIVSILSLFLSWGSHFMWFSELFFKYVPLYNKFRTVSMILVILQITIPLLAILGLNEILFKGETMALTPEMRKARNKKLTQKTIIAAAITGGICLLFAIFPRLAGDFSSPADEALRNVPELVDALVQDRKALLVHDAWTSLVYILIAFIVILLTIKGKMKTNVSVLILIAAVVVNMWTVDKRYLNKSHFMKEKQIENQFAERPVDKIIHQDTDSDYRVLDLSVNTFNDAMTSYHHKTIGGYSPVKLQRYQDMIDHHIQQEMTQLVKDLNTAIMSEASDINALGESLGYYPVLAMLNTRYIIINGESAPLLYDKALGNAWFVSESKTASTAKEEMTYFSSIDPASQAIVYDDAEAAGTVREYDSEGVVTLDHYSPNRLDYTAYSTNGGLAVFSEIYYPAGWKAYVDGEEQEILRVNYILRGLNLDKGSHDVTFVYDPSSFRTGKNISMVSSIAIIALLLLYIVGIFVQKHKASKC